MIGHINTDGRLARYAVKGMLGGALRSALWGCGHKFRMILAHLRALWDEKLTLLLGAFRVEDSAVGSNGGLKALAA